MASYRVRIVNDDQKGLSGARVRLSFKGLTRGIAPEEYTDSDGSAYFSGYEEGDITVYIDGRDYGSFYYEDGGSITVTK
jgi:hypothetical protein